jgi:hypothetical protein
VYAAAACGLRATPRKWVGDERFPLESLSPAAPGRVFLHWHATQPSLSVL